MHRFWKLLPAGLLASWLGLSSSAYAQPPGGERPRGPQPQGGGGFGFGGGSGPRSTGEGPRGGDRRSENSVDAWVKTLAERITDPHDTIRDSARAGIVAVGEPALPLLRNLANGNDDARATAAKKLIGAIEGRGRPRGVSTSGFGRGGSPMTAGGMGGPLGRGGPPFGLGGPMPFGRGPTTGGFAGGPMGPMGPMGGERRGGESRPGPGRPEGGERRGGEGRPEGGDRRPEGPRPGSEGRPMERRPEGGERRPEGGELRPEGQRGNEGRTTERRPEGGERRPEAPQPKERRPDGGSERRPE